MRYVRCGFAVFAFLLLASCEETQKKTDGPAVRLRRQGIAVRDVTIENHRLDKEARRLKKELEQLRKLSDAQKHDIEKILGEKGKLAEQQSGSAERIKKLTKQKEGQAVALRSSTQTSDRLSRENERLRKEVDKLRKQVEGAKKEEAGKKETSPPQNATPQ